jgi:hypothetical protein
MSAFLEQQLLSIHLSNHRRLPRLLQAGSKIEEPPIRSTVEAPTCDSAKPDRSLDELVAGKE